MKDLYKSRALLLAIIVTLLCLCGRSQTSQSVYNFAKKSGIYQPIIMTAQSCLETGWFKSYNCTHRNNILGFKTKNGYLTFDTWQDCVLYYKNRIQTRLRKGENYWVFLKRIYYASDEAYEDKVKSISEKLLYTLQL